MHHPKRAGRKGSVSHNHFRLRPLARLLNLRNPSDNDSARSSTSANSAHIRKDDFQKEIFRGKLTDMVTRKKQQRKLKHEDTEITLDESEASRSPTQQDRLHPSDEELSDGSTKLGTPVGRKKASLLEQGSGRLHKLPRVRTNKVGENDAPRRDTHGRHDSIESTSSVDVQVDGDTCEKSPLADGKGMGPSGVCTSESPKPEAQSGRNDPDVMEVPVGLGCSTRDVTVSRHDEEEVAKTASVAGGDRDKTGLEQNFFSGTPTESSPVPLSLTTENFEFKQDECDNSDAHAETTDAGESKATIMHRDPHHDDLELRHEPCYEGKTELDCNRSNASETRGSAATEGSRSCGEQGSFERNFKKSMRHLEKDLDRELQIIASLDATVTTTVSTCPETNSFVSYQAEALLRFSASEGELESCKDDSGCEILEDAGDYDDDESDKSFSFDVDYDFDDISSLGSFDNSVNSDFGLMIASGDGDSKTRTLKVESRSNHDESVLEGMVGASSCCSWEEVTVDDEDSDFSWEEFTVADSDSEVSWEEVTVRSEESNERTSAAGSRCDHSDLLLVSEGVWDAAVESLEGNDSCVTVWENKHDESDIDLSLSTCLPQDVVTCIPEDGHQEAMVGKDAVQPIIVDHAEAFQLETEQPAVVEPMGSKETELPAAVVSAEETVQPTSTEGVDDGKWFDDDLVYSLYLENEDGTLTPCFPEKEIAHDDEPMYQLRLEEDEEKEAEVDVDDGLVYPKSIPAPSGSHPSVCISFLVPDVPAKVVSTVFEEALRVVRPGGPIYVLSLDENLASKHEAMAGLLQPISCPGVRQKVHEIQVQEILTTNEMKIRGLWSSSSTSTRRLEAKEEPERRLCRWAGRRP